MPRIQRPKQLIRLAFYVLVWSIFISSCTPGFRFPLFDITPSPPPPQSSPILQAETIFRVQVPFNTPKDRPVYLEIVDEVTGLGLNPLRYEMEASSLNHYTIHLPITIGSTIKYRYLLGGTPLSVEYTAGNRQVRYRIYPVKSPGIVQDIIASWTGFPYTGATGRITGTVKNQENGQPIADVLLTAGGVQTISAADGSFLLEDLAPGIHQLAAYSIHGDFAVFVQGADVAPNAATEAQLELQPADYVNVTFLANTPALPVDTAQVRMIGNLYRLGNTFADLGGGMNTVASRAPILTRNDNGTFEITLKLPVGFDLRYKYSLGDGFWNAEHEAGKFVVRQLIIPAEDTVIEDNVITWTSEAIAPVVFIARTPANSLPEDTVSIQFNPFTWLEPIPMWRAGQNEWMYIINSPLELLGDVHYRYCRNEVCTYNDPLADNSSTIGTFTRGSEIQYFQDQINNWPFWSSDDSATTVPSVEIETRPDDFVAGIEYDPSFQIGWSTYQQEALKRVTALNANMLVLTPTWSYTSQNPPSLSPVPGQNGLWADWLGLIENAQSMDLPLAVYPLPISENEMAGWWEGADRDLSWWYSWYDRYQTFLLHHAHLAQQAGADALIIGGPEVSPSYPNGVLADGSPSGVPAEAESRWKEMLHEVRKVYKGQLLMAIPYQGDMVSPGPLMSEFDQIYLLWSEPLSQEADAPFSALVDAFERMLERDIRPLHVNTQKPIILALSYASTNAADQGLPSDDQSINLQKQADLYNAALSAINTRQWIHGFISRGYFPTTALQDGSASVNGKPSYNILWYWYPLLVDQLPIDND
jgi:hypothetical protein